MSGVLTDTVLLHRITSFGAPVTNVYKLVVEGENPISLQTSQVEATHYSTLHAYVTLFLQVAKLAKLMKAYISFVNV